MFRGFPTMNKAHAGFPRSGNGAGGGAGEGGGEKNCGKRGKGVDIGAGFGLNAPRFSVRRGGGVL